MADTIREQVIKAIVARLEALSATPVSRREQYDDEDEFINVWDQEQETEKTKFGTQTHTMPVTVEFLKTNAVRPYSTAADELYGQVVTAVLNAGGQPEPTLGGLVISLSEVSALVITPDPGLSVVGCAVTFEVVYETQNGNPFAQ